MAIKNDPNSALTLDDVKKLGADVGIRVYECQNGISLISTQTDTSTRWYADLSSVIQPEELLYVDDQHFSYMGEYCDWEEAFNNWVNKTNQWEMFFNQKVFGIRGSLFG